MEEKEILKVIEGLLEIAEIAMPDSYFDSDSRIKRAQKALKILKRIAPKKFRNRKTPSPHKTI